MLLFQDLQLAVSVSSLLKPLSVNECNLSRGNYFASDLTEQWWLTVNKLFGCTPVIQCAGISPGRTGYLITINTMVEVCVGAWSDWALCDRPKVF